MKIDPNQPSNSDDDIIPAGEYLAKIKKVKRKVTKTSGDPMMTVVFDVLSPEQYAGCSLFGNYVLTERARWKVIELSKSVGQTEAFDDDEISLKEVFEGHHVWIDVTVDYYNGKETNQVKMTRPITDEDGVVETPRRSYGSSGSSDNGPGRNFSGGPPDDTGTFDDDDIPF